MSLEQEIAIVTFRKMLRNYFSICDFDQCCKIMGYLPMPGVRDKLQPLHCINMSEMSPNVRAFVVNECCKVVGGPIEAELPEPESNVVVARKRWFRK